MYARQSIVGVLLWCAWTSQADAKKLRVPQQYPTLQAAINFADAGDVVLVDDGVYSGPGNHSIGLLGKAITIRSKNGPVQCVIDCAGEDSAFLFADGEDANTVISGLTLTHCENSAVQLEESSPTFRDCLFLENSAPSLLFGLAGGAIRASGGSSPTVERCEFRGNFISGQGDASGGAIACEGGDFVVSHCVFADNRAGGGAAIFTDSCHVRIESTLMANNTASRDFVGGALIESETGGFAEIVSCTIVGTQGGNSPLIGNWFSAINSIIWFNNPSTLQPRMDVRFCNVEGTYPGDRNIDADPLFVAGSFGDYYLSSVKTGHGENSPCVDGGDGTAREAGLRKFTTRIDGKRDKKAIDMGYHYPRR